MISFLIITYNESCHISRCIKSISKVSDDIVIVDSFSNDNTELIANKHENIRFYKNKWSNHSNQINWAIDNINFKNEFIFRIDADEVLTDELVIELKSLFEKSIDKNINGFYIKRRTYFMGRWIKYGGYYPTVLLRLWRKGFSICEDREMDEHMVLISGSSKVLNNDFIDDNLRSLSYWTDKHNLYSEKEVLEYYKGKSNKADNERLGFALNARIKKNKYYKLPKFIRAFLMFIYRYIIRLGFLDGREGLIFYVLQTFWYRFLIDSKIYQNEKNNVQE
ncbi:glycosyltransferase [Aliivibrio fischeri]|uniref:glycosyltransferase family 2 protein n=1 Tax=Aliivibrio fischeri TaxID=668 RepID=UPI0012DA1DDC|nr:glycosyltransferase family 2 protein [Aliivibrio fischeri]MUK39998.1 glycosyltransferase [Aliivibrio fischeri]